MTIPAKKTGLNRRTGFGYTCHRCLACCRFKKIQVNPYEIARLARRLDLSTTEFIIRHTTSGGTVLRFREDGTCAFLTDRGCGVHPDRPLVCRLYPLRRHVRFPEEESFDRLECEPECRGVFNKNGTIEEYLEEQGAGPFLHAADLYLDLLWRLLQTLQDQRQDSDQAETLLQTVRSVSGDPAGGHDLSWIDMDRAVSYYCEQSGTPVPADVEAQMVLHIKAVREWSA